MQQVSKITLATCAVALIFGALCTESRSPYSKGKRPNNYQDQQQISKDQLLGRSGSGHDLDGQGGFAETGHFNQHQQQPSDEQFSRETPDESDESDDDGGSDSSEAIPVRNFNPGASAAGEEVDASELAPFGNQQQQAQAEASAQQELNEQRQWANSDLDGENDSDEESNGQLNAAASAQDGQEIGLDTNIANAKIEMSPKDMSTAAGHHYHGHGVHGMLKMGAETGKKGAFKWYDKHPVGGKGRR